MVPIQFIPAIYQNMQIHLRDIVEGKARLNTTANEGFSWEEFKSGEFLEKAVLSYREERRVTQYVKSGKYAQLNIIVANEV